VKLLLTVKGKITQNMFKTILITIINEFNWDKINGDYLRLFEKSISELKLLFKESPSSFYY
jgi:hypothetical protein